MIGLRGRSLMLAPAWALPAWVFAAPALAQQQDLASAQPDLVPVALWTLAVVCLAILMLSLGYLYRRARGEPDELIPKTVDPVAYDGTGVAAEHTDH